MKPLFPDRIFAEIGAYADAYAAELGKALASLDKAALQQAAETLEAAVNRKATIFVCGNGGSAAIAGHFTCDHMKGASAGTNYWPSVVSLSANIELITAIANDTAYDNIFAFQLAHQAKPGDVLVTISSSGGSPNILAAIDWAKLNGVVVLAMTSFDGGQARQRADVSLHIEADNYGVAEDAHQALMHILAQYLRQKRLLDPGAIGKIKF